MLSSVMMVMVMYGYNFDDCAYRTDVHYVWYS